MAGIKCVLLVLEKWATLSGIVGSKGLAILD